MRMIQRLPLLLLLLNTEDHHDTGEPLFLRPHQTLRWDSVTGKQRVLPSFDSFLAHISASLTLLSYPPSPLCTDMKIAGNIFLRDIYSYNSQGSSLKEGGSKKKLTDLAKRLFRPLLLWLTVGETCWATFLPSSFIVVVSYEIKKTKNPLGGNW